MIDIKLYTVQAFVPVGKDPHGGNKMDWRRVYGQIRNKDFEFTTNQEHAVEGDFNKKVPNCKVIYQAKKKENIVKIQEKIRKSKKEPMYLEVKIDEDFSQDFNSLTNTIDAVNKIPKEVGRPLLVNLHCARGVSALSRGREHSNYRGIVTILIILLIITNLRHIYQHILLKGGTFLETVETTFTHPSDLITLNGTIQVLYALHWIAVVPIISFLIEKVIGPREGIPRSILFGLVVLNLLYSLAFPVYFTQKFQLNAVAGMFYLMFACIWCFKFWSYHHIWHDIRYHVIKANKLEEVGVLKVNDIKTEKSHRRKATITKEKLGDELDLPGHLVDEILKYPSNVRAKDVWMFCFIPTLCFQLEYPFYKERNILGFIFRLTQCFFLIAVWVTILTELTHPGVEATVSSFRQEKYLETVYNFFCLSAPNTYGWLVQFYLGFHCYLNAFADLTGFSDKNFYDDWWNSVTLDEYWRKWNLPMHYWLTRHIYFPLQRRKLNKTLAMIIVFVFSGIFHEYMLAGICGKITLIGFNGMMGQLPVIMIQQKYRKLISPEVGNAMFWILFCVISQPGGLVTLYYIMTM